MRYAAVAAAPIDTFVHRKGHAHASSMRTYVATGNGPRVRQRSAGAARAAAIAGQRKEVIRPKKLDVFQANRLVLLGPRLPWTCPEWTSGSSGNIRSMKEFRDENEDCCTNVVFGDINCLGPRDADFQCLGRGDGARGTPVTREERRDDRQEARGDRGGDHELLRLALLRRFATGILEIGSRSERNVATIDKRVARNVGMTDKRRAAIGEATTSCYALRFLRRFATGILEIGSRSERNVATIDKRARGTSG